MTNAATPKSNERSPLLPDRAPPGIPSRPAQLERSVSDPALRNVAQGQYLLPTAPSNSSSNSNSPRLKTRRAKSSQSLGKAGRKKNEPRLDKGYYRDPLWLFGLALMVLGEFGNFLSYSFAPASLVAPLGSVALVANVGLAPLIVKEVRLARPSSDHDQSLTLYSIDSRSDDAIFSGVSWLSAAALSSYIHQNKPIKSCILSKFSQQSPLPCSLYMPASPSSRLESSPNCRALDSATDMFSSTWAFVHSVAHLQSWLRRRYLPS